MAFTLLVPGTVTLAVPAAILSAWPAGPVAVGQPSAWLAVMMIVAGGTGLLRCIWDFAVRGRGTLAPVDPPTRLVVSGLYRYVRNPMYVSVIVMLAGEALLWRSAALAVYSLAFLAVTHGFIVLYEEPVLKRAFGDSYAAYARSVSRWIPGRPHAH